jgi:hypothetical protein
MNELTFLLFGWQFAYQNERNTFVRISWFEDIVRWIILYPDIAF